MQKASALFNQKVVITAGPTREFLDPVRFLSSPATGTLGLLLAQVAEFRGADVTVIAGPMSTYEPFHGKVVPVVSANDMMHAVNENTPCDVFVASAAVADYCLSDIPNEKKKKSEEDWTLTLSRTPDILASVSGEKLAKTLVGFCAQTHNVLEAAQEKLERKQLDWIVANQVYQHQRGFGPGANTFSLLQKGKTQPLTFEDCPKEDFARVFWDIIEQTLPTS
jgi:phosphopantothenoylcysteine decarboxylase/phosphopantothenate--cysteine ligase